MRLQREEVQGWATAQRRRKISAPMRWLLDTGAIEEHDRVLDFGCGLDPHWFRKYDPYWEPDESALREKYNFVTCNYVLNVIGMEADRARVVKRVHDLLEPGGAAFFSIWRKADRDTMSRFGYQCGWSKDQWTGFFCEQPGWATVRWMRARTCWLWGLYLDV